jgi:hypothetical protein
MPQQIEVRAVHELAPAAAQTNGAGGQFVGLPSTPPGMELRPNRTLAIWRYEQRSSQPARPRSTNPSRRRRTVRGLRPTWGVEQGACRFSAHGGAVVERDF